MQEVELVFYNDYLYWIYTNEFNKISEALSLKYGKPKIEKKEKVKSYVNKLGNKIEKLDLTFTSTFNPEESNINCTEIISRYHNKLGEPESIYIFTIRDKSISDEVNRKERELEEEKKKKEENEKRKSLDDL